MKKMVKMLWISIFLLGICSSVFAGPNEDVGTVIGGVAGGLLGNTLGHGSDRTIATISGAVIGGLVGNQVGHSVDTTERYCYAEPHCHPHRTYFYESRYYTPYPHTFIGRNGRLCRRFTYFDDYGDRIGGTACCHFFSSSGRCLRWVVVS